MTGRTEGLGPVLREDNLVYQLGADGFNAWSASVQAPTTEMRDQLAEHVRACLTACEGMADPETELAALREAGARDSHLAAIGWWPEATAQHLPPDHYLLRTATRDDDTRWALVAALHALPPLPGRGGSHE